MDHISLVDAIDGLYAAALDSRLWTGALQRTSALLAANTSALLVRAPDDGGWRIVAASGLSDEFVSAYNSRWHRRDPLLGLDLASGDGPRIRGVGMEEHRASPFGMPSCEAADSRHGVLAAGAAHGGMALLLWRTSADAFGAEDERRLACLWPHVVRALTIQSATWQADRPLSGGSLESVIDLWHVGVIAFSAGGSQVYANRAARQLAAQRDGLSFSANGPVLSTIAQTRTLRKLVQQLADDEPRRVVEWLRISRPSGAAAYEAALCRAHTPAATDPRVLMLVAATDASIASDRAALRRLHGLTDLEARVADCLVKTMPLSAIATTLDLSIQTTRWYVKQVREKMDAGSQGHLLRIMLRGLTAMDWQAVRSKSSAQKT